MATTRPLLRHIPGGLRAAGAWVLVLGVYTALGGCAARPSSTDDHHRVERPVCAVVVAGGHMRNVCCRGSECWFTD